MSNLQQWCVKGCSHFENSCALNTINSDVSEDYLCILLCDQRNGAYNLIILNTVNKLITALDVYGIFIVTTPLNECIILGCICFHVKMNYILLKFSYLSEEQAGNVWMLWAIGSFWFEESRNHSSIGLRIVLFMFGFLHDVCL